MADLSIDSSLSGSVDSKISGSINVSPVTVAGIPSSYDFHIKELPKITFGVDPLTSTVTFQPITLTLSPVDTNISIKEIPSVRAHFPANYCVALSFFGVEVGAIRLCGEGQVITEPYRPNRCEVCGGVSRVTNEVDEG
jgi:hypothetical protein